MNSLSSKKKFGACTKTVNIEKNFNWPTGTVKGKFLQFLKEKISKYPGGKQVSWGIPFIMSEKKGKRVIIAAKGKDPNPISLNGTATYLCFLHQWEQMSETAQPEDPTEGRLVAEYELEYMDGTKHIQPIRARFEVGIAWHESPGPAWLALPFKMHETVDPVAPPSGGANWGGLQSGVWEAHEEPLVYAMPNPNPDKKLKALKIRGYSKSPLIIAGITLYNGSSHPLRHLPRRTYHIASPGSPSKVEKAEVDLGVITRTFQSHEPRSEKWLASPGTSEKENKGNDLIQIVGAEDATVSVKLNQKGKKKQHKFSLGEAFHKGKSHSGNASLEILGKQRQWMQISVIDSSTNKPTPVRIHFSNSQGEYIAPYGHHEQVNTNWFEDYGADVVAGGRSYAYVPGEFTSDMPVGDIYAEISKGYEYKPIRRKITIKPGQKKLELKIDRWKDFRKQGWVTADTHVHFISPHTAWLEGQAEGINVVNLLASQWGRLFTNVGDFNARIGVVEDDTIVYVGTENRNHMLGHMSMLGTKGLPVYPMCCGGPTESWVGDPEFMMLADWARENKRKGGVVIRPHYPYCGHTEDPVPIIKNLVDALEIHINRDNTFPMQEWYRYLNCGYRVAVVGGTDKMGAYCALGWLRTYAKTDPKKPFTYDSWAKAVRAGNTFTTNGPLIDFKVEGVSIGDTIRMSKNGGTIEVHAFAECFWPLGSLEIIYNGKVIASQNSSKGSNHLYIKTPVKIPGSGWIAARCYGLKSHPEARGNGAHTSPVYIKCGDTRAFDGPAAEHMLALVEGGMEYLNTIATAFDEPTRKRMVKQFKEVQHELKFRLVKEADHIHHHGDGSYHTHGHGAEPDHHHE